MIAMAQNIPVPAEVVRQMATEASDEIHRHRDAGRKASARSLENDISEAFSSLEGKDGEFVSIDGSVVSTLAAASTTDVPSYVDSATVFLEQYDVW